MLRITAPVVHEGGQALTERLVMARSVVDVPLAGTGEGMPPLGDIAPAEHAQDRTADTGGSSISLVRGSLCLRHVDLPVPGSHGLALRRTGPEVQADASLACRAIPLSARRHGGLE